VFYPTAEEFQNPLSYIAKIRNRAEKFGICKIIPPEGCKPKTTFPRTDHNHARTVKFSTKRQYVNHLQEGKIFKNGDKYTIGEYMTYAVENTAKYRREHGLSPHTSPGPEELSAPQDEGCTVAEKKLKFYRRVEDEFWRIVETNPEDVVVDYANDLNSSTYGSGFEHDPDHSWNFNKFHEHPLSLLKELHLTIPGLTHPWLYLGSMFTAFCWHTEDHFLYSVNYMHDGAPKTWYGIPSSSADKFESALKESMPERFRESRDLLYQLIALLSPSYCLEQGVEVFHTVQEKGEVVVTFPNAFHGGFSHGLNCAEAVNFAVPEWLPYGRQALEKYHKERGSKRNAVFAHDQLLWSLCYLMARTASKNAKLLEQGKNIFDVLRETLPFDMYKFARILHTEFSKSVREETLIREWLKRAGLGFRKVAYDTEAGQLCYVCRCMPFFSSVKCSEHPDKITCAKHAFFQCNCEVAKKEVLITVNDAAMQQMAVIVERIATQCDAQCQPLSPETKKLVAEPAQKQEPPTREGSAISNGQLAASQSKDSTSESREDSKKKCAVCGDGNSLRLQCMSCDNYYHAGCVDHHSQKASTEIDNQGEKKPFVCEFCAPKRGEAKY